MWGIWAQRFCNLQPLISFEVLRGVLRCSLSSFYLDFISWFAVPMCHVIFLREVGGDWYLQLRKSLLFLSAGYWGSGAEARVGFDFLIVFSTLAVCFFLGAPRSLEKERMCGLSALFYLSFRLEKGEVTPHS